jgi:uncharacterized membrane protein SpoIIM required for sporulation
MKPSTNSFKLGYGLGKNMAGDRKSNMLFIFFVFLSLLSFFFFSTFPWLSYAKVRKR